MIIGHWPEAAIGVSRDSLDIRIPLPAVPAATAAAAARKRQVRPQVTLGR